MCHDEEMRTKSRILVVVLLLTLFPAAQGHAEDIYTDETETSWGVISSDDGFSKSYTIYKNAINVGYSDFGTENTYSIEIQCENKKLEVLVYADPIGIYPTTDLSRIGYAQVKIDSGKISKYKYLSLKDSSGIGIWSPKTLTTAMLKGKRQVAFKIASSIQADTVANFALADLAKYVPKFKSLGCPLR
jgi:hypothetical protein